MTFRSIAWMTACLSVVSLALAEPSAKTIPGVHVPLPIDPTVDIDNASWLLDLYLVLLNRQADSAGFAVNFQDLENGGTKQSIYGGFIGSAEFQSQLATLSHRAGYVTRVYQVLLLRSPQPNEVASWVAQLQTYLGGGGEAYTWVSILDAFYGSVEYKLKRCQTGYYTLGAPVAPGALLLRDIWAGRAQLQTADESDNIALTIPSASAIWDQKLPVVVDPENLESGRLISFTRALNGALNRFTIVLLESYDNGTTFTEVAPLWTIAGTSKTFYDGHVSVDNSVCPPRYVMAMECIGNGGAASLCVSESPTPGRAYTWTWPVVVVDGCTGGNPASCGTQAAESASTGVLLTDGSVRYAAWTQVYDGLGPNDPLVHTYSQMAGPLVGSHRTYFGTVMGGSSPIGTMMSSEPHPWCTDAWDCNNRDKQDWKREGAFYYALYNGANYYRCDGAWGISISRSASPVQAGEYARLTVFGDRPLVPAALNNTCGISYPMLNVIGGELYVYYAYRDSNTAPQMKRSKIVPR